jgi:hypothetical protein
LIYVFIIIIIIKVLFPLDRGKSLMVRFFAFSVHEP